MKNKFFKKLFRDIMDEVLPDDLSSLAATVKEVTTEQDEMSTGSRVKTVYNKIFKEPDLEAVPMPSFLPKKRKKFADVVSISEEIKDEASSNYGTSRNVRKKSKLKNISNEETEEPEAE